MRNSRRTPEQLRKHFEVERELAQRLLHSTRAERPELYRTLYDELFARVPHHPRLTRRDTPEASRQAVAARMALLHEPLKGVGTFLEFAPGDCRLAFEVCRHVESVLAADISDQTGAGVKRPANFRLILYDGYDLNLPNESVDLAFSYQFLEHLHPDDVDLHFLLAHRLLRPGGAYVFSTPHRFSGPHDISAFFSDTPQGFHFQEWTYGQMGEALTRNGFSGWQALRSGKPQTSRWANRLLLHFENGFARLPRGIQKQLSRRLFQSVIMVARK